MIIKYPFSILILFLLIIFSNVFYGLERAWSDTVVATVTVGSVPNNVAYDSIDKEVYVTSALSNSVYVINTTNLKAIAIIFVGNSLGAVAYDLDSKEVYVTNFLGNTVSVINTSIHQVT